MAYVEDRVDRLEEVLQEFIVNVGIEFNKLYNSQMRTEAELRAFKEEMKEFKDEMKEETKEFKDEMRAFKDEMKDFKDEMKDFKEESRRQTREMNRQWGELANKLGTMVEYLVAPSLPRIIRAVLDRDVIDLSVRRKRKLPDGRVHEYDAIAVAEDVVCLNSTKSTLRNADVDRFIEELAGLREVLSGISGYAAGRDISQSGGGGECVELRRKDRFRGAGDRRSGDGSQESTRVRAKALVAVLGLNQLCPLDQSG